MGETRDRLRNNDPCDVFGNAPAMHGRRVDVLFQAVLVHVFADDDQPMVVVVPHTAVEARDVGVVADALPLVHLPHDLLEVLLVYHEQGDALEETVDR